MNVDDIPGQLEQLFDRARAAFDAQITSARKVVADLNADKAVASQALAELKDQCTKAKVELDAVRANLDRASTAVALDREIKKSRSELERLKGETAEEEKILAILVKKRTQEEARTAALEVAAREAVTQRTRSQEMVEQLKIKLGV